MNRSTDLGSRGHYYHIPHCVYSLSCMLLRKFFPKGPPECAQRGLTDLVSMIVGMTVYRAAKAFPEALTSFALALAFALTRDSKPVAS